MQKQLILVAFAMFGIIGCQLEGPKAFSGRGRFGGPNYYEGAPYYGSHVYPYSKFNSKGYYGDNDIGFPYYLCDKIMYYKLGGAYCFYRNHMRFYVLELPEGGRYLSEPARSVHQDASK